MRGCQAAKRPFEKCLLTLVGHFARVRLMIAVSLTTSLTRRHRAWHEFWTTLHTLNRRAELERLVRWARRKGLPGPLRLYQSRLEGEEVRLARYAMQGPQLLRWVWLLHRLKSMLFPPPRYLPKGAAAAYRSGCV
jgi:hypothetical protein